MGSSINSSDETQSSSADAETMHHIGMVAYQFFPGPYHPFQAPVAAILKELVLNSTSISEYLFRYLHGKSIPFWMQLCRRDSHHYCKNFMEMTATMSNQARIIIVALCMIIKDKEMILDHLNVIAQINDTSDWMPAVMTFIQDNIVSYDAKSHPLHNVPEVNLTTDSVTYAFPGLDLLFWCYLCPTENLSVYDMKDRISFTQMWLDFEMLTLAKQGYDRFWKEGWREKNSGAAGLKMAENCEERDDQFEKLSCDRYSFFDPNGVEITSVWPFRRKVIEGLLDGIKLERIKREQQGMKR